MKTSSKKVNGHQPEKGQRRKDKKKTDIRWNSAIFFQVGLIIALISSVYAMDLKVGEKELPPICRMPIDLDEHFVIGDFVVELDKPKTIPIDKPIAKAKKLPVELPKIADKFEKVDDDSQIEEPETGTTEVDPDAMLKKEAPITTATTATGNNTKTAKIPSAIAVEYAPIFPGCEKLGSNRERIDCMSAKIGKFVKRKFNTGLAEDLGLTGRQRISVRFTIDKNGDITDVMARAKDPKLEKEAQRVINKLPEMTPGKQGETEVDVIYTIPIVFMVK